MMGCRGLVGLIRTYSAWMSERQRFWLKVVVCATLPVWVIPFALFLLIGICWAIAWELVSDLVD